MMENREIKFEYGFKADNSDSIIKKVYDIEKIQQIEIWCDVWFDLPLIYRRQFTGLKDKNGIEIYEGDVLSDEWEVSFDNNVLSFIVSRDGVFYLLSEHPWDYGEFEIIGNIHENPELL